MANLWIGNLRKCNDENKYQDVKSAGSSRSSKQQVFGDLKNVMHGGHNAITPFKSNAMKLDLCAETLSTTKYLRNEVLVKEHLKKIGSQQSESEGKVSSTPRTDFDFDFFECSDFAYNTCSQQCLKSDFEIWAEMSMISDSVIDKLLNESDAIGDIEDDSYMSLPKEEDFPDYGINVNEALAPSEAIEEEYVFSDTLPELPEMDDLPMI